MKFSHQDFIRLQDFIQKDELRKISLDCLTMVKKSLQTKSGLFDFIFVDSQTNSFVNHHTYQLYFITKNHDICFITQSYDGLQSFFDNQDDYEQRKYFTVAQELTGQILKKVIPVLKYVELSDKFCSKTNANNQVDCCSLNSWFSKNETISTDPDYIIDHCNAFPCLHFSPDDCIFAMTNPQDFVDKMVEMITQKVEANSTLRCETSSALRSYFQIEKSLSIMSKIYNSQQLMESSKLWHDIKDKIPERARSVIVTYSDVKGNEHVVTESRKELFPRHLDCEKVCLGIAVSIQKDVTDDYWMMDGGWNQIVPFHHVKSIVYNKEVIFDSKTLVEETN